MTINTPKEPVKIAWASTVPDKLSVSERNFSAEKGALDRKFKELVEATIVSKRNGQDIKGFAESTTAHGLKYAFSEESSKLRRLVWFLAFLAALVYLTYQMVNCSIEYYKYPMKAQNKLTRMKSLQLPTVTICNLNHADSSKMDDPKPITDIYRVAKGCMWSEIMNMTLEDMKNNETYRPLLEKKHRDVLEQVAWEVKDMFKFCMWNGKKIRCQEILTPFLTLNGKCFKLNGNISNPMIAESSGSNGGFFAAMKTSLEGHTISDQGAYGFKVLLHHMYDTPDIYSQGIVVSPGFSYHISFVTDTIKYLPYPFKAQGDMYCKDYPPPTEGLKTFEMSKHSLTACIFSRAYAQAQKLCGCNSKNCTLYEHLGCFEPNFNRIHHEATKTDLLGCPIPCSLRSYRPVISQAAFPSPDLSALMKIMDPNGTTLNRDTFVGLSLFFGDLINREQVHEPVYDSLSFMGVLGGNMGILLGASILTVAELMEFLLLLLWRFFNKDK
ncbi:hypothetical protein EGW08_004546, partial [Elysia chlorotica]